MIAKAIVNPDDTINVGTPQMPNNHELKQKHQITISNTVLCVQCQEPYNLPIGAYTFRCKKCGNFNNTNQINQINQCNIL